MDYQLLYEKPADRWMDALPLGNGRLGAMVYGHTAVDRIQLNEDSLWYGKAMDRNHPYLKDKLEEIRQHIFQGNIPAAEDLIQRYMLGAPYSMRHYETLGEVDIGINRLSPFSAGWLPSSEGTSNYHASLDLVNGVHTQSWKEGDATFTREIFISHPDQVLCIRYRSTHPFSLQARYDRALIFEGMVPDERRPGHMIRAGGWGSMFVDENHTLNAQKLLALGNCAGTHFAFCMGLSTDGTAEDAYTQLYADGATEVCLYIAAATDNRDSVPKAVAQARVEKALARGFEKLLLRHTTDFAPRMRRCELDMGQKSTQCLPERLADARHGLHDPGLAALYFAFGRYLMLSGGREDSAALNLQGIWCKDMAPMWDSKYTTNINLEMNYWPAEVCHLPETHESLLSLLHLICENGKKTARVMYGMRGSVCHHNTDFYGDTAPQDQYMAATGWPTGGAWLSMHLWEHYLFSMDISFLRGAYPIMREFALFFLDYLCDDGKGSLVTCPSLSPENRYILPDGYDTPVCAGPAMDSQILRDLFSACVKANEILKLEDPLAHDFEKAMARLPRDQVGSQGQLLEWQEEYPEKMPGMGHISHLYGAYPSSQINGYDTPALMQAVRKSLEIRVANGADPANWPLAWRICEYARLWDGVLCEKALYQMIASSTDSLLNGKPVFQIDGILGTTAGIAEMLLQSHAGRLRFLPALPPSWKSGKCSGLRARGGLTIDLVWENGKWTQAQIHAHHKGIVRLVASEKISVITGGETLPLQTCSDENVFSIEKNRTYLLIPQR